MDKKTCSEHFDMESIKKAVQNLRMSHLSRVFCICFVLLLKLKCDFIVYIITSQKCDVVI
jgi:hypothetical protein